jgi:hypothetical protein
MKRVLIIFITICLATASFSNDKTVPKLSGPYLGQKPPGTIPVILSFNNMQQRYKLHNTHNSILRQNI